MELFLFFFLLLCSDYFHKLPPHACMYHKTLLQNIFCASSASFVFVFFIVLELHCGSVGLQLTSYQDELHGGAWPGRCHYYSTAICRGMIASLYTLYWDRGFFLFGFRFLLTLPFCRFFLHNSRNASANWYKETVRYVFTAAFRILSCQGVQTNIFWIQALLGCYRDNSIISWKGHQVKFQDVAACYRTLRNQTIELISIDAQPVPDDSTVPGTFLLKTVSENLPIDLNT